MSLEKVGFTYNEKRTRPFRCTSCSKTYKMLGPHLDRHYQSHLEGGESVRNNNNIKFWTEDEFNMLISALVSRTPMREIMKAFTNRTYGSVQIKIQAINNALKAPNDKQMQIELKRYSIGPYLRDLILDLKRRGMGPFDIDFDYKQRTLETVSREKEPNNIPTPVTPTKAEDLIRTVDENFDALKDSLVDLVSLAVEERTKEVLKSKEEQLKAQEIEIAALRTVVEAAKQSSLVGRLQKRLMGGE